MLLVLLFRLSPGQLRLRQQQERQQFLPFFHQKLVLVQLHLLTVLELLLLLLSSLLLLPLVQLLLPEFLPPRLQLL